VRVITKKKRRIQQAGRHLSMKDFSWFFLKRVPPETRDFHFSCFFRALR
jgi:hypothetical protein